MIEKILKIEEAENIIREVFELIDEKDYKNARVKVEKAYDSFKGNSFNEGVSICLSLISFLDYSEDKNTYESSTKLLHDAIFMAQRANSDTAILINELVLGNLNFSECNREVALIHYNNALKEIRASKENPDDGKDGPVVDMNYELISYGHMKIDYKFILELIQNYISTMDDTSEQEEVDKRLAEIQEYIETLEKENKKLAGLLFSIFEKVKNDKNAYSGQNISEVLENMRHEAIEMVLFSFADKWCCDRENLIFIAHNYRNGVINDLTSLKESANYQAFSEKSEIPMTKLKYKSSLAKELKILLDEEVVPLLRE